jgi:hypothetical protein
VRAARAPRAAGELSMTRHSVAGRREHGRNKRAKPAPSVRGTRHAPGSRKLKGRRNVRPFILNRRQRNIDPDQARDDGLLLGAKPKVCYR